MDKAREEAAASSLPWTEREWERAVRALEMSPQQARIIELVVRGMGNKQIAAELGLSESTVKTYLARVFVRLNVADRMELALRVFSVCRGGEERDGRQPDG
jgi:DNA-binding NarL/FixJ family response regulator